VNFIRVTRLEDSCLFFATEGREKEKKERREVKTFEYWINDGLMLFSFCLLVWVWEKGGKKKREKKKGGVLCCDRRDDRAADFSCFLILAHPPKQGRGGKEKGGERGVTAGTVLPESDARRVSRDG